MVQATSKKVFDDVQEAAHAQRVRCLDLVLETPGLTSAEIAERLGLDRHAPGSRLPELRKGGWVQNGQPRVCSVSGYKCLTWFPASDQRELF